MCILFPNLGLLSILFFFYLIIIHFYTIKVCINDCKNDKTCKKTVKIKNYQMKLGFI